MTAPQSGPGTRLSRWKLALGLAAALAVGVGGWNVFDIHVRHRLAVVHENQVYKSSAMTPSRMAATARKLGLRSVVDLRTFQPGQDPTNTTAQSEIHEERDALAAVGVKHIHLPTPQVPTQATVDAFLAAMSDPANLPTLIHCYHGIGRTEVFSAIYHMEYQGWSNERARGDARFILAGSSFSDTSEKGRFLQAYRPTLTPAP